MELTNFSFYYSNSVDGDVVGAIAYRNSRSIINGSRFEDDFDVHIVIIYETEVDEPSVQHTMMRGDKCQVLSIGMDQLQNILLSERDSLLFKCFLNGEIISDYDGRIALLRSEFLRLAGSLREQQLFVGFAHFLKEISNAKDHMKYGRVMDAYHSTLGGLQHWAEIELIERGIHPETAIFDQITGLNTPVRKLYEELTDSSETLEQRIELVLLACEFSMTSKMADCSKILLRIFRSRRMPWTIQELMQHPELEPIGSELPLVLRKLVSRKLIKEISSWSENRLYGGEHIRYSVD